MKRYIEHVRSRPAHERRQHAVQIAGAVTGVVFVVWLTTLGARLGGTTVAQDQYGDQSATVLQAAIPGQNTLMVATTTEY